MSTTRRVSLEDLRADYPTFARLALKIRNKKKQVVPLALNQSQWMVEEAICGQRRKGIPPRIIELKARQTGLSTDAEGRLFHLDWSIDGYESLVIAHKKDSAKKVFNMFRRFAHYMPTQLDFRTRYATKTDMEFSNSSTMSVEVAGEGSGRGHTPPGVHLSEMAQYKNPGETLDAVMSGVPDTLESLVVIESTAFGMNEFQSEWVRAKTGKSDFVPIFVPWYLDPSYRMAAHFGYDECDEIEKDLLQKYSLDLEQIAWRRWTLRNKCRGDIRVFQQENPSDDRECFLVSGRPVFSSGAMDHYSRMVPPYAEPRVVFRGDCLWDEKAQAPKLVEWADGPLFIYRWPKERCLYVGGADPSEGDVGSNPSPIVMVNRMTLEPDAVWYGKKRPDHLAETMRNLCIYYNRAHAAWEANNHGLAFMIAFEKIYDDYYMRPTSEDSVNRGVSDKPGYNTNVKSRTLGVDNLVSLINDQRVEIFDANLVEQICKFHYNAKNKPIAQEGAEDDILFAYIVALAAHQVDPSNALEPLTSDEVDHALSELQRKRVAASMGIEYELNVNRETITAEELERLDEIADSRDARARAVTGRSL